MAKINTGRVILGGLLAGLVINVSETILNMAVISTQMEDWLKARNVPPISSSAMIVWVMLSFMLGIVIVWLYAAIRPRFGPGVGTAIMAGLAVFFLAYLYASVGMSAMGMYPADLMFISLAWGLVETVAASVVGAWAYKE